MRSFNQLTLDSLHVNEGQERVVVNFDDGMEMSYVLGTTIKPIDPGYQVKLRDLLSGNIPFRQNVSHSFRKFDIP